MRLSGKRILLPVVFAGFSAVASSAYAADGLVINEIMQSNVECIMDDLNEFPDSWVELYNAGREAVDLSDYKLGIKSEKKAWRLPSATIDPGGRILVYCDKTGSGMHADFRLESGNGGNLYLYRGGVAVDAWENIPKMASPDISYGRSADGGDNKGFLAVATPGGANPGVLCCGVLGEPVFSHEGRVSSVPFSLSLSLPADAPAGTVIRYTTDGSSPSSVSPRYAGPIRISGTSVVRARLFADGYASPYPTTHSYLFHPRRMSMPIVSVVSDRRYFDDPSIGIHCVGNDPDHPNYDNNWRRPVNIEIFMDESSGPVVNQLIETRLKGHWSRRFGLKSHVIYANKRFGTKRFEYEFFPDDCSGITDWKSMELRNAGNDFIGLYLRDAMMQRVFGRNVDVDWQPYQPCVFMVNGEMRGMLNLRTRSNEDYVAAVYDGLEDIDMVENWWELKVGSLDSYNEFHDFYSVPGHSLMEYEERMDVDEFLNVFVASIYFDNKDFPANNMVMWRPASPGGRWRWIMKDLDNGLGFRPLEPTYNTLKWILDENYDAEITGGNSAASTLLFRRLEAIEEFREKMIDRLSVYMGDFLRPDCLKAVLQEMSQNIEGELPYHFEINDIGGGWHTYSEWRELNMRLTNQWIEGRNPVMYDILSEHYGLGRPVDVAISGNRDAGGGQQLEINGTALCGDDFDGKWYVGRRMTVSALQESGIDPVTGWEVTTKQRSGAVKTELVSGARLDMTVPDCESVSIRAVSSPTGIDAVEKDACLVGPLNVYDMSGRRLGTTNDLADAMRFNGVCIVVDSTGRSVKVKL